MPYIHYMVEYKRHSMRVSDMTTRLWDAWRLKRDRVRIAKNERLRKENLKNEEIENERMKKLKATELEKQRASEDLEEAILRIEVLETQRREKAKIERENADIERVEREQGENSKIELQRLEKEMVAEKEELIESLKNREVERKMADDIDNVKLQELEKDIGSGQNDSVDETFLKMEIDTIKQRQEDRIKDSEEDRKKLEELGNYQKDYEERNEKEGKNPYMIENNGDGNEDHSRTHRKPKPSYCDAIYHQQTNIYAI